MCRQPQVHFQCGCIKPRPAEEIPTDHLSSLVKTEDGLVYKLCLAGMSNQEPCEAQFIEAHESCSTRVNTLCVDCLANAYGQPLPIIKPPKQKVCPDFEAFGNSENVCKSPRRRSSIVSVIEPIHSLWEHAKSLSPKQLLKHDNSRNISENF